MPYWHRVDPVLVKLKPPPPEVQEEVRRRSAEDVYTMPCPEGLEDAIREIQGMRDSSALGSSLEKRCLTLPIPPHILQYVPRGYTVTRERTIGGISRVFDVTHETATTAYTLKVTDVSRGLGKQEMAGYAALKCCGIPSARVIYHKQINEYHLTMLESLECTLTTLLLAVSSKRCLYPLLKNIHMGIEHLLALLARHALVFVDFTMDNIMCRYSNCSLEFVLIDPQFIVPQSSLARTIGREYAATIDRIHVCTKLLGMAMVGGDDVLLRHAKSLCKECLGYVPSISDVVYILASRVPKILHAAHRILETSHSLPPAFSSSSPSKQKKLPQFK